MRTKKELLELLLAEWEKNKINVIDDNCYSGLCSLIHFGLLKISEKEEELLLEIIKQGLLEVDKPYLFKSYLHQPRVEWLKKQIELCEKK